MTVASEGVPTGADEPALVLRGLRKRYGDVVVVDGLDLVVQRGEFLTLLGPSGSGKTTTLRMVAGFTLQDEGSIEIGGDDMSRVPAHRREVGMVFQSYALFPHMTAAQNVAFPLQMRGLSRQELGQRVAEALALVKLETLGDRYPRQLSGGQQQRIALARAVVFRPRLLLMDEPLGALDRKLREALQLELLRISRQLRATVIYVTHDQEEALALSDRIAVFNGGRIEQLGSGEDLYQRPASLFVADFIGESNILRGTFSRESDRGALTWNGAMLRVEGAAPAGPDVAGGAAALVVRPEQLRVEAPDATVEAGRNALDATVTEVLYLGPTRKLELALADGQPAVARAAAGGAHEWRAGDHVRITWAATDGVVVTDTSAPTAADPGAAPP